MKTNISDYGIKRSPRGGYGQYQVYGNVNGVDITAHSTNSEAFDFWNDENYPEKQQEAIDYIERALQSEYENQMSEAPYYISISFDDNTQYYNSYVPADDYLVDLWHQADAFLTKADAQEALDKFKQYGDSKGWTHVTYSIEEA